MLLAVIPKGVKTILSPLAETKIGYAFAPKPLNKLETVVVVKPVAVNRNVKAVR